MPAPPPESDPAIVHATGVLTGRSIAFYLFIREVIYVLFWACITDFMRHFFNEYRVAFKAELFFFQLLFFGFCFIDAGLQLFFGLLITLQLSYLWCKRHEYTNDRYHTDCDQNDAVEQIPKFFRPLHSLIDYILICAG